MTVHILPTAIERTHVVNALAGLRQDWQQVEAGESLLSVRASVGFLLADVAIALGLTGEEQQEAFGSELAAELRPEIDTAIK